MTSRPNGRFPFLYHSILSRMNYPALTEAYREYLERMIDASEDLVTFDKYTVPFDQDLDSPALREYGDFV